MKKLAILIIFFFTINIFCQKTNYVDTLYVTAKNGLSMRSYPHLDSTKVGVLAYGKLVYVLSNKGEEISIEDDEKTITGKMIPIQQHGNKSDDIVYVFDQFLGSIENIQLDNYLIKQTEFYSYDQISAEEYPLNESVIKLLLTNSIENTTLSKIPNTTTILKKNGILNIPQSNSKPDVVFKDNLNDNEEYRMYKYYGFSNQLNEHIIGVNYYEGSAFFFVNLEKGKNEDVANLLGYPFVSPNGKSYISFNANPYENTGEIEIYTYYEDDGEFGFVFSGGFKFWMPLQQNNVHWVDDNNVIIRVMHSKVFWDKKGFLNSKNHQFLKISW